MNISKYKRIVFPLIIAGLLLVGLLLWLNGSPPTAHAAPGDVYCVTPGGGTYPACDQVFTNVQAAVDASTGGEEIRVAASTYTGVQARFAPIGYPDPPASGIITQVVYISKTVTIRGGYTTPFTDPPDPEANPTMLDAQGQGRILFIVGNINPTIKGLRITNGDAAGLGGYQWGRAVGGGVYIIDAAAIISNSRVFSNTAYYGGGLYLLRSDDAMLNGNAVISNTVAGRGGGLNLYQSDATLSGNTVSANTANDEGGGLHLTYCAATLSGNTIISNTAAEGGGLFLRDSDAALNENTVISNTADYGGGLYVNQGDNTTLSNNTVTANTADHGGGLYLYDSDSTLDNNFVTDNGLSQPSGMGSGLYVEDSSLRLRHNTIARNHSVGGQGEGLYVVGETSQLQLHNTILVSHSVGISVAGGSAHLEGTFWGEDAWANTTDWSGNVDTGTVNVWGDPAFADPDAGDYHIGSASDAIDAGAYPALDSDFDGDSRPAAFGPDVGADERHGPGLRMSKLTSHAIRSPGESVTYTLVVTGIGTGPVDDAVLVDRLPTEQRIVASMASTGVCAPLATPVWGGGITCTLGTLNLGQSAHVTLTAQVTTTLPPVFPWPIRNSAWITSTQAAGFAFADVHSQNCHVRLNDGPGEWDNAQAAADASTQPTDVVKVAGYCAGVTSHAGAVQVVYVDKTLTLQGGWNTDFTQRDVVSYPTTLDALGQGRVLLITGNITPTIEGLGITGGDDADQDGGGAYVENAAVTIRDNQVFGNTADDGGGLFLWSSDATLNDNTIISNTAADGGGLFLYYSDATLSGNTISANTAVYDGGGLFLYYSDATLSGNTIATNTATDDGGLYIRHSNAMLSGNIVVSSTAADDGGGLFLEYSAATLNGNTVSGSKTADRGGGLYMERSAAALNGNTVFANTASVSGGGVYLWESDATLNGDTVISNIADWGGGLYLERSAATLTNTVVADNRANSAGGGLYTLRSSPRLLHTTIARNGGGDGSGVYVYYDSAVTLTNTILVGHEVGINVTSDCTATLESTLWHNNTTDWDSAGAIVTGTHNTWGDPLFDADGYHLLDGSAAIDQGVDAGVTTDVDGEIRPMGLGYDIGADEFFVCAPLSGVFISGPTQGYTDTLYTFTAVVTPPTATPPFTYTWAPDPESGQGTGSAGYQWAMTGIHTITLTAESCGGGGDMATHAIEIGEQHDIYLPLVLRDVGQIQGETR